MNTRTLALLAAFLVCAPSALAMQPEEARDAKLASAVTDVVQDTLDVLPDAGTKSHADTEPNNTCVQATSWGAGATSGYSTGTLTSPTDVSDWSKVEVLAGEVISATLYSPSGADYDLEIYDPNCVLQGGSYNLAGSSDAVSVKATLSGFWRIQVFYFSGPNGQYDLYMGVAQDDAGSGGDAGGVTLNPGPSTGSVGRSGDDTDAYSISVPPLTLLTVTVFSDCYGGFNPDLYLYDSAGFFLASSTNGGCAADAVSCYATLPTTVQLDVRAAAGKGGYTLSVTPALSLASSGVPAC